MAGLRASQASARELLRPEVLAGIRNLDLVARQDTDVVHSHLSGDVGQNLVAVFEFDTEHRVRERLGDRSF